MLDKVVVMLDLAVQTLDAAVHLVLDGRISALERNDLVVQGNDFLLHVLIIDQDGANERTIHGSNVALALVERSSRGVLTVIVKVNNRIKRNVDCWRQRGAARRSARKRSRSDSAARHWQSDARVGRLRNGRHIQNVHKAVEIHVLPAANALAVDKRARAGTSHEKVVSSKVLNLKNVQIVHDEILVNVNWHKLRNQQTNNAHVGDVGPIRRIRNGRGRGDHVVARRACIRAWRADALSQLVFGEDGQQRSSGSRHRRERQMAAQVHLTVNVREARGKLIVGSGTCCR